VVVVDDAEGGVGVGVAGYARAWVILVRRGAERGWALVGASMLSLVVWSSFAVVAQVSDAQKPVFEKAITAVAVELYADWGENDAGDHALGDRFLAPALAKSVFLKRRICRKAGCIDPLTCQPGRATVLGSTLQATTTADALVADVALQGVKGQARSTARWTMQKGPAGLRLTKVDCVTGTRTAEPSPLPLATATVPPPAAVTPSPAPVSPPSAAPIGKTKIERFARDLLREVAAAGDDQRQQVALMKRSFTPRLIRSILERERNCLATLKSGTDDPFCNDSPLTCTTGAFVIDEIEATAIGGTAAIVKLRFPSGQRCEIGLYLDEETEQKADYYDPQDPDRVSKQAPADAAAGPGIQPYTSPPRGACAGFVFSCSPGCSEIGCYRNTVGGCGGAPQSCSSRGQSSCHSGCYWDPSAR